MHVVRYRPADAIRWIEVAIQSPASTIESTAGAPETLREAVLTAFGRWLDLGKETTAELLVRSIRATEYRLHETFLEVQGLTGAKRYPYADLHSVEFKKGDRFLFRGENAKLTVRPYAYFAISGLRIPLGWERDGLPVPYRLLAEEIALRSGARAPNPAKNRRSRPKTR
jgi:hypothetical protein